MNPGLAFHIMAKPAGAQCNCRCDYCFYHSKERLYPGSSFRMSDPVMESYIRQTLSAHPASEVPITWQGGEPTLMGLDFFRRAVEAGKRHARPGQRAAHSIQTNGVLIDESWCRFFHDHGFLVGLSLDGPQTLHDAYRRDRGGKSVFSRVVRAVRLMQAHRVEFNILCTVNAANCHHALEVYRFFRDEIGARYVQFIPVVERMDGAVDRGGSRVTSRSVRGADFGLFLSDVFDEWVRRDVGVMFIPFFDAVLASYLFGESSLCVLRPTCGDALALEHNGDLYSCDHYVDPDHLLGNILETPVVDLVSSERQKDFGRAKSTNLPSDCRECRFLFTCHGECPKNRVLETRAGEPGLNWLCDGLKGFFAHTERPMRLMAGLISQGRPAEDIMRIIADEEGRRPPKHDSATPGRNDPCPCGSGLKFKKCHGRV